MALRLGSNATSRIPHLVRALVEKRADNAALLHELDPTITAGAGALVTGPQHAVWRGSRSSRLCRHASTRTSRDLPSKRLPTPPNRPPPTTSQNPSTSSPRDPKSAPYSPSDETPRRKVNRMLMVTSIFSFAIAIYTSYVYTSYQRSLRETANLDLPQNSDVSNRYNDRTRDYDDEVDLSERFMFLKQKRKRLVQEAYGDVLEVSVGTGRNMDLYDLRPFDEGEDSSTGRSRRRIVKSLTFVDQSPVMVELAERKFAEMEKKRSPVERFRGKLGFVVGDAGIKGVVKRPEGGFDTIVQTMGVCSMVDAVGFLRRLGDLCRQPGEVKGKVAVSSASTEEEGNQEHDLGGRILLLEHGRGYYDWLNRFLDNGAKNHADHYGCWWNKDVGKIIQESGLVVERIRRYHWGTTWEYVLRPAKKSG